MRISSLTISIVPVGCGLAHAVMLTDMKGQSQGQGSDTVE